MTYLSSLGLLAGIYLAVLASPGPNFFILSQMALDGRSAEARWVVLGLSTGSLVWVLLSVAGLATLLSQHPLLATAVRVLGALYLVWYGARLLRSALTASASAAGAAASDPGGEPAAAHATRAAAYRTGLLTALTNPKAAAFWTSAFAAVFPADAPAWFFGATIALVAALSLGWHLGITLVFGVPALRNAYLRLARTINGVTGGLLVLLGLQRLVMR